MNFLGLDFVVLFRFEVGLFRFEMKCLIHQGPHSARLYLAQLLNCLVDVLCPGDHGDSDTLEPVDLQFGLADLTQKLLARVARVFNLKNTTLGLDAHLGALMLM